MNEEWIRDLQTGIEVIDSQHREFISRANRLLSLCVKGNLESINDAISFLKEYVDYHFDTEESIMNDYGYPDSAAHKSEHGHFKQKLDKIVNDVGTKGMDDNVVLEFNYLLVQWFTNHIQQVDMKLARFLKSK